jgi:signal transduction histidine kinase
VDTDSLHGAGDPASRAADLRGRVARLEAELGEIELLHAQALGEAEHHETRRAQAAERLEEAIAAGAEPAEASELSSQLVTFTRRAAQMEAQVEILTGKREAVRRHRADLVELAGALEGLAEESALAGASDAAPDAGAGRETRAASKPSRRGPATPSVVGSGGALRALVQTVGAEASAEERLRRSIARAINEGPAQRLTNAVLEVRIIERLLERDPAAVPAEMVRLAGSVQAALDETRAFVGELRPPALDDLGLVPSLRHAIRDRSRTSTVAIELESLGTDRRLGHELEGIIYRIVDGAIGGFVGREPQSVLVRLDWGSGLDVTVQARVSGGGESDAERPPVLAALIERWREEDEAAGGGEGRLPDAVWNDLRALAGGAGLILEREDGGRRIALSVPAARPG